MRSAPKLAAAVASVVFARRRPGRAAPPATESATTAGTTTTTADRGQRRDRRAGRELDADTAVPKTRGLRRVRRRSTSASTGGSATSSGDGVTVDGATVTITAAGTYRLSGTLTDGQVVVDAATDAKVTMILDGVDHHQQRPRRRSPSRSAEAVEVILADGSENTLSDASAYADDAEANAALYSAADLTIAGDGALTVHGNGNDGIASQDGLVISSRHHHRRRRPTTASAARTTWWSTAAPSRSPPAATGSRPTTPTTPTAGYIAISGGTVTVTAGGDGVDAATDIVGHRRRP